MIYTVTMNPAIDYFITVDNQPLMDTEVNRASRECFKAAGKGINVSLMLETLGIRSTAIALLGGFAGEFIKESIGASNHIMLKPIEAAGINRINVKIYNGENTICINGSGVEATEITKNDVLGALMDINEDDWVLICGSLVKNIDFGFVRQIIELVHSKQAKLVMDMESLTLDLLKQFKPHLIKPNLYELGLLMGDGGINEDNLETYLDKVLSYGVESVLVSMGENGAVLACGRERFRLSNQYAKPVNKIGSGDAMLAGYVGALSLGLTLEEALIWGGAAGAATASTRNEVTCEMIERFIVNGVVTKEST